jgi:hypothetical protein
MVRVLASGIRAAAIGFAALLMGGAPLAAQSIETIDPNQAIDADLSPSYPAQPAADDPYTGDLEVDGRAEEPVGWPDNGPAPAAEGAGGPVAGGGSVTSVDPSQTYKEDDLIGAAEGLFGEGAEGLARMIENLLAEQGEPNAYIVGREASGAFIVGARYGSGTLFHKIEGQMPVYWTGPSIGFDAGANAGNTFVLVYNLFDTEELYERYPAGEGQLYAVGGLTASYLRKGDVVLIPIRVGAGLRLGVNAGYMRFSKEQRWLPF